MKKSDVIKELKKYIQNIDLISEPEYVKCADIIPEIEEPWWTKTDGYLFDNEAWRVNNEPDPTWKQVVYRRNIGSVYTNSATIGVRPKLTINLAETDVKLMQNKINIGIHSFTIINRNSDYIVAICDSIIALKPVDKFYVCWNESSLREWLNTDGLVRIFASPNAVDDWTCVSRNALYWNKHFSSDYDRYEWILSQSFTISETLQESIDKLAGQQFNNVLPVLTKENKLSNKYSECEFRITNPVFYMLKESHALNWNYRSRLEKFNFGMCDEWLDADRTAGAYCYFNSGLSRITCFYPKDINNIFSGHHTVCSLGALIRPLLYIETKDAEKYSHEEIGYLFGEKVFVFDVCNNGIYVTPILTPFISHPLYERTEGLNKYKRNLYLFGCLPKDSFNNFGSGFQ